jgi:two-component system chemotaxis response regulator CheB
MKAIGGKIEYKAIVIGTSAGGLRALKTIILALPQDFCLPILIVQHMSAQSDGFMAHYFNQLSHLNVKEADPGEPIRSNHVYIAPANYHMLVEKNATISLTVDDKVSFSRPSVDVLFESAAYVYKNELIGILLTGANNDGAHGIEVIHKAGGLTIAQAPTTAEVNIMPQSAIDTGCVDKILDLEDIAAFLSNMCRNKHKSNS